MEQLIIVGIVVFFSILEAVARKGKEKAQGGSGQLPDLPLPDPGQGLPPPAPRGHVPPAYDDDPSFDDAARAGGKGSGARRGGGSEGLIPPEIWEEIQILARGGTPPSKAPVETPPPSSAPPRTEPMRRSRQPRPRAPEEVKVRSRKPAVRKQESRAPVAGTDVAQPVHEVHLAHAGLGTPVGSRLTPFADPQEAGPPSEARAARRFLEGGVERLREAVILREVLGPPVSLRTGGRGEG